MSENNREMVAFSAIVGAIALVCLSIVGAIYSYKMKAVTMQHEIELGGVDVKKLEAQARVERAKALLHAQPAEKPKKASK